MRTISIVPYLENHSAAVLRLLQAQHRRQRRLDPRLAPCRRVQLEATLVPAQTPDTSALVALDTTGQVRGYVQPGVWELAETSILRAFLTARNGVTQQLALPDPQEAQAHEVAAELLEAASSWWHAHETTGDLIRWPSADRWMEGVLRPYGFHLDSVCALRSLHPLLAGRPAAPGLSIRLARPADEEALVCLFEEELRHHERVTPFVRCSPAVLAAFRRKLARRWAGESVQAGAPLVLVAEQAETIVGMAENTLLEIGPNDEPGLTSPGRYGCIDNVSVREDRRGQGIGRRLVQAVCEAFDALPLKLAGVVLWYNPDNREAAHFWTHLGFEPLWTTYQRLHTHLTRPDTPA
jgi:GNAT superfamily N-acetyltransferase